PCYDRDGKSAGALARKNGRGYAIAASPRPARDRLASRLEPAGNPHLDHAREQPVIAPLRIGAGFEPDRTQVRREAKAAIDAVAGAAAGLSVDRLAQHGDGHRAGAG